MNEAERWVPLDLQLLYYIFFYTLQFIHNLFKFGCVHVNNVQTVNHL